MIEEKIDKIRNFGLNDWKKKRDIKQDIIENIEIMLKKLWKNERRRNG